MKRILYAVLFSLIFSQIVAADDKSDVEALVKKQFDAVISVLQKKDICKEAKDKEILDIITPIFNFPLMAQLTIKKYWSGLNSDKKRKFTDLFTERLKKSYIEKLNLYTDEKIVYKKAVQVKNKIHVTAELVSKTETISMLYKFYKSKTDWKIYDVEIEGVSIVSTYRSQFDQVLRSGTIDDLLLKLQEPENE